MSDNKDRIIQIIASLPSLNWDQQVFIFRITGDLMHGTEFEQDIGQESLLSSQALPTAPTTFPEILLSLSRLELNKISVVHRCCAAIVLKRIPYGTPSQSNHANLFPNHQDNQPPNTPQQQIDRLLVRSRLLQDTDRDTARQMVTEALEIAKDNRLPHTYIESEKLNLSGGDRSGLVEGYKRDIAAFKRVDDWRNTYFTLMSLIYECRYQGDLHSLKLYGEETRNLLRGLIYSDTPVSEHQDFEGYARVMMRI